MKLTITYVVAAVLFVLFSGFAEGMVSLRLIVVMTIVPVAFVHILFIVFKFIRSLISSETQLYKVQIQPLAGIAFLTACLAWGMHIDFVAEKKSKAIGDEILLAIKAYKSKAGACPQSLKMLSAFEDGIPKPALRGARYDYWVKDNGDCMISFDGPMFITCAKGSNERVWFCSD